MDVKDLKDLLENTDDKFSILASREILAKYKVNLTSLVYYMKEFLSDEEKVKLLSLPHFKGLKIPIKIFIINNIEDENVRKYILSNKEIIDDDIQSYHIIGIIRELSDEVKKQILLDQELLEKLQLQDDEIQKIISELGDEAKIEIIMNQKFNVYEKLKMMKSLKVESISELLIKDKEFLKENMIQPYEVISGLEVQKQIELSGKLEDLDLTNVEKRKILATLAEEVKETINTTNLPEEYRVAISMKTLYGGYGGGIVLDLERDLKDYQELDDLIVVNPEHFNKEEREKFTKLCEICPNMQVANIFCSGLEFYSTASEYIEGEKWIDSIIDKLKPEYTKAQKMAIIDNEIGKKISYTPNFDTEVENQFDCRAIWKIISTGYGVCNGIAKLEQYIFNRVGIESELISSEGHAFLKIKDIELPLANGEKVTGNTIIDPTWNLANHRFGGKPNNFCISYEEARKHDLVDGEDYECHKNDEELQDATLNLDNKSLRSLFKSVGLASENGVFPIANLLEQSEKINKFYENEPDRNIKAQLKLLEKTCPEFATCQNSSMNILSNILLNHKNLRFNKGIINRVYDREDDEKSPVMYIYIDSNELGRKFYYADKNEGQFLEVNEEEFTRKFECYSRDLEKANGLRPWEYEEQENEKVDLSRSSGRIVATEGEGR